MLAKLYKGIESHERNLQDALYEDLRKHPAEAFATEIGLVKKEISYAMRNLKRWMRSKRVATPALAGVGKSWLQPSPQGQALIISPWNYPCQLSLSPLVGSIAAGNCSVIKPSELSPASALAVGELINDVFSEDLVGVFHGDANLTQHLLEQSWDHVFFTGSTNVGRIIATECAPKLTRVTLELGGKSPCILSSHCDIDVAIRRIVFGKFINAGQSCIAPDYLLVHENQFERVAGLLKHEIYRRFGENAQKSKYFSRIINSSHFDRLAAMIDENRSLVLAGGDLDRDDHYIAPTLIGPCEPSHSAMQEEIFGPILPILTYRQLEDAVAVIDQHPNPLALYLFSNRTEEQELIMRRLAFGGACINDTIMHIANLRLPFGGVRQSGVGRYHGKFSFDAFTMEKPIYKASTLFDPPVRYVPYTAWKEKILRFLLR